MHSERKQNNIGTLDYAAGQPKRSSPYIFLWIVFSSLHWIATLGSLDSRLQPVFFFPVVSIVVWAGTEPGLFVVLNSATIGFLAASASSALMRLRHRKHEEDGQSVRDDLR